MKYKCAECGEIFTIPRIRRDDGGDRGEDWQVCPACGSDDYEEVGCCHYCREFKPMAENHDLRDGVCDDCLKKAELEYQATMETLSMNTKQIMELIHGRLMDSIA